MHLYLDSPPPPSAVSPSLYFREGDKGGEFIPSVQGFIQAISETQH